MEVLRVNGWEVYFHPIFIAQFQELDRKFEKLSETLDPKQFKKHPTVKRYEAVSKAVDKFIPADPLGDEFSLTGDLEGFGRLKGKGLNDRYRLFFKAFEAQNRVFIIWLGYPRKEGDKKDCYATFKKKVDSGEVPTSLGAFMEDCDIKGEGSGR